MLVTGINFINEEKCQMQMDVYEIRTLPVSLDLDFVEYK